MAYCIILSHIFEIPLELVESIVWQSIFTFSGKYLVPEKEVHFLQNFISFLFSLPDYKITLQDKTVLVYHCIEELKIILYTINKKEY